MNNIAKKYGIGECEIKFRVWDSHREKMYYTGEQGLLSEDNLYKNLVIAGDEFSQWSMWRFNCNGENYSKCLLDMPKDFLVNHKIGIIMQYTGLKDKNGKEIYCGDIVCTRYSGGNMKGEVFESDVVRFGTYDIGANGYEYNFLVHGHYVESEYLYSLMAQGKVEVIGSIFENPELIQEEDAK